MSRSPFKLKGFDKLLKKLERLPKNGAKKANRKGVRAGTTLIQKVVKKNTPRDKGLLVKTVASKITGRGLALSGIVGSDVAKLNEDATSSDGKRPSNLDWLVEEGHTTREGIFVPPSGHMRRSAVEALPAAEAAYAAKLATEIEKEAIKA